MDEQMNEQMVTLRDGIEWVAMCDDGTEYVSFSDGTFTIDERPAATAMRLGDSWLLVDLDGQGHLIDGDT